MATKNSTKARQSFQKKWEDFFSGMAHRLPELAGLPQKASSLPLLALLLISAAAVAQPAITSLTPAKANVGASVTIAGSNFSTTAANNIVYFGHTRATVTTASASSLTVTVPAGAIYGPVTVTETGAARTAYSPYPFQPDYDNASFAPGVVGIDPRVDFNTGSSASYEMAAGDIDGDGKTDVAVIAGGDNKVYVYRNTSTSGSLSSSSLATKVPFTVPASSYYVQFADINSDGKLDMIASSYTGIAVFKNTATSGSITSSSFAAPVTFTAGGSNRAIAVADFDGNGKPDVAIPSGAGAVYILPNTSTSTTISFGSTVSVTGLSNAWTMKTADLDGDGKSDLVMANLYSNTITVLRNTSASGSISFGGAFTLATPGYAEGVALMDVDGDGKTDIVTMGGTSASAYRNIATSGTLTAASFSSRVNLTLTGNPFYGQAADMDGDGKLDLVASDGSSLRVHRNVATSGSISATAFAATSNWTLYECCGSQYMILADLDGDGYTDALNNNNNNGYFSLFRNHPIYPVAGAAATCVGGATTLTCATTGGTWSSSNTTVATVGTSGIVNGLAAGTSNITYNYNGARVTRIVTVNSSAGTISGTATLIAGTTATLTSTVAGGTWSSGNTAIATVGTSGVVSGVAAGTATISYSLGCASPAMLVVTVTSSSLSITSFSPGMASPGAAVTITGTGFNAAASGNIVYFGSVRATVTAASSTSLTVTLPDGALHAPISVLNTATGKSAYSPKSFLPSFDNTGLDPNTLAFSPRVNLATPANVIGTAVGDLDNDGKTDVIAVNYTSSGTISVYRNISASGSLTTSSFSAASNFAVGINPFMAYLADIDVDGKLDVVVPCSNKFSILRNTSVAGTISFATMTEFSSGISTDGIAINDIDGDGRPDIAIGSAYTSEALVYRNTSAAGSISLASPVSFAVNSGNYGDIVLSDLDGDNKPDMVVPNYNSDNISIFRNTATSGTINSGSFAAKVDFATGNLPRPLAVADFDGDGKPDIAAGTMGDNKVSVFRNTGSAGSITTSSFAARVEFSGIASARSLAIGDFNGDGRPDIAMAGGGSAGKVAVLRNTATSGSISSGSFAASQSFTSGVNPFFVTACDLDNDGKADLISSNFGSENTLSIFRNALPSSGAPITGTLTVCSGLTTPLAHATPGGTWSSANTSVATVGTSGIVTGMGAGTAIIRYVVSATTVTATVTVNTAPSAGTITSAASVCPTATITSSASGTTGGAWVSSNTATGTINAATGTFTGLASGTSTVSYTVSNSCGSATATKVYTVNPTAAAGSISGPASVCTGAAITLASSGATPSYPATWSSSATGIATVNATTGAVTGITTGTAVITYQVTGCGTAYAYQTVNVLATPTVAAITGTATVCPLAATTFACATPGGTWSSGSTTVATVGSSGSVTGVAAGTAVISYTITGSCGSTSATRIVTVNAAPNPGVVSGVSPWYNTWCMTASSSMTTTGTAGGTWSSSNTAVATVYSVNGTTYGVAPGTANVSYTVTNGCGTASSTYTVTIKPLSDPGTISGPSSVCVGTGITLTSSSTTPSYPHTWSSSSTAIATVNSSTGVVTGVAAGSAVITYTVTSCGTFRSYYTVNVLSASSIAPITGTATLCPTYTTTLISTTAGGTWSSANSSVATVGSSTGIVTGIVPGTATISYSVSGGCGLGAVTRVVTVNSNPAAITGYFNLCKNATTTLSSATAGGTWSSSNTTIASVGSSSGVFSGVNSGTATISYIYNGCRAIQVVTVATLSGTPIGVSQICPGGTMTFTNTTTTMGGTWSVSAPAVGTVLATAYPTTFTALSPGVVTLSYTCPGSTTAATRVFSVTGTPGPLAGTFTVCPGATTALSLTHTEFGLPSLVGWSSSATSVATVSTTGVVTGISAGTARISYRNFCGTVTQVVTVIGTPPAITGTASVCAGGATILANTMPGGVWSSSNDAAATVGSTGIVAGVAAGIATISYTVTNACGSNTVTRMVTVNAVTTPGPISGTATVCAGSATALSGTPAGGTWTTPNTSIATVGATGTVSGISVGTAKISYTVTNGCGVGIATTIVTVQSAPQAVTGTASVCPGSFTTLLNAIAGGTWASSADGIATVGSAGVVTGVSAGIATITYTLTNACGTNTATRDVTVNATAAAGTLSGTTTVCSGAATTLTSTVPGGTWSSGNTVVAIVSGGVVTGQSAGTAVISYTVTTPCGTSLATQVVTVNPLPEAGTIMGLSTVNTGATLTLFSAAPGGTWSSSHDAMATVGSTGIVTGISAGTPTISYAVTNGCGTAIATKAITVNFLIATPITGTLSVCAGGTTALSNVTPGGAWSSANPSVATIDASGLVTAVAAGTSTISYSVSGSTATATLVVNALPPAIGGAATVCEGSVTTLTNTAAGTWSSSDDGVATVPSTPGVVSGIAAGTADITFTQSSTGCQASRTITVNALPAAISGSDNICAAGSASYSSAPSGGTWATSSAAIASIGLASGVATGNSAGTVTITYTLDGCRATKIATVAAPPVLTVAVSPICVNGTHSLNASTAITSWNSDNSSVASVAAVAANSGLATGNGAGTATISFTSAAGCTRTQVITVNAAPVITGAGSLCVGGATTLSTASAGAVWSSSDAAVASISSAGVVTGAAAGEVTITLTTGFACSAIKAMTIDPVPADAITGPANVCIGSSILLFHPATGGTWACSNGNASIAPDGTVTGIAAGPATITYFTGASCFRTYAITVNNLPAAIGGTGVLCEGAAATLTNTTPGGSWINDGAVAVIGSVSGIVTSITSGTSMITYQVMATGCYTTKVVTINEVPGAISGANPGCVGSAEVFSASPTGGSWTSGTPGTASVGMTSGIVTGMGAGVSIISYTLPNGCSVTKTVTVNALPGSISGTLTLCEGGNTSLTASNAGLAWSSSSPGVATVGSTSAIAGLVTGIAPGTAAISYSNAAGCARVVIVTVTGAPAAITGGDEICTTCNTTFTNSVPGGTWSSSSAAATVGVTTGVVSGASLGTAIITYRTGATCFVTKTISVVSTPSAPLGGASYFCTGASAVVTYPIPGGTWSSSNPLKATIDPVTGLATGITAGTVTLTYTISPGFYKTRLLSIYASPSAVSGPSAVCEGATITLSSATTGGTWTSDDLSKATIVSTSGVLTGIAAGTVNITYTVTSTGCNSSRTISINSLPSVITGSSAVCVNSTATLTSTPAGGTWTASSGTLVSVGSATGAITGLNPGNVNISYTLPTGCKRGKAITVNAIPGAITGTAVVNELSTTALGTVSTGGAWSSSNTSVATIGATGIVTGVLTGNATITYQFASTGCYRTRVVTVNPFGTRPALPAAGAEITAISIYPNPTSGTLVIETPANGAFVIYTIDGKIIEKYDITAPLTSVSLPHDLAAGIYMCRYEDADGNFKISRIVFTP